MEATYQINHSTEPSIVGTYDQIQEFSRTHPVPMKLYFYQNEDGKFSEDIEFPIYRMESKAKLTDLVSNVPLVDNLMVSPACLEAFKKMNLPEHQSFPLKFIYKGNMHEEYSTFSIVKDIRFLDYISWKHSRFYKTTNWHRNRIEEYSFSSLEEMMITRKEFEPTGFGLLPEIKLKYHNDFDIINFARYPMPLGFLCSEVARNKIIEAGLTGFDFEKLPDDMFVDQ